MHRPSRRKLPHTPPSFVGAGALYFVTICGVPRGQNQFAKPDTWKAMCDSAEFFHARHRWHVALLLAMPDHVHGLIGFPKEEEIRRVVAAWKHYLTHAIHLTWQRDFFDHRLRSHEDRDENAAYIRMNPVRAGLVDRFEDWPYVWTPTDTFATPV